MDTETDDFDPYDNTVDYVDDDAAPGIPSPRPAAKPPAKKDRSFLKNLPAVPVQAAPVAPAPTQDRSFLKNLPPPPATQLAPEDYVDETGQVVSSAATKKLKGVESDLAQPFKDIGSRALAANDFATNTIFHPVDTAKAVAEKPGANFRTAMRGINENIPFANSAVEAAGGPPAESKEDTEAALPGLQDFTSFAAMQPTGKMVGGITAKAAEAVVPAAVSAIRKLAARGVENDVDRAREKIFEGGTKRTRGGLSRADDKLDEVLHEVPSVRAAALKGDEKLAEVSEIHARRGAEDVSKMYAEADANSAKPAKAPSVPKTERAPDEYKLTDRDIMEAESVPEHVDPELSGMGTQRIDNPNFPTRPESPDIGETIPRGRARIIPEEPVSQVREVSSRPFGDDLVVRKYVPADNFESMEFENVRDPSKTAIVHGSTKTPGKWQTSHFDAEGPSGDIQSSSPSEALRELLPSEWKPKVAEAPPGVAAAPRTKLPGPQGSAGDPELLFVNARAAEAEAAKLTAKAERYGKQADAFQNPESSMKMAKRAKIAEIAADDAKLRAANLRAQAEAIESRGGPPPGMPAESPFAEIKPAKVEPVAEQPIGGARGADVVSNMDREIARLMKGGNESRAVAKQLEKIRDEFQGARGDSIVPSKDLRAEQTDYQKKSYGKAMPGEHEKTAAIAANEIASRAVGDVVVKHVTGMDYAAAKAASKANPDSVAGRLFKANRDIEIANRIQSHLEARVGQKVPSWWDKHVKQIVGHAAAGSIGGVLSHYSPLAGEIAHGIHGVMAAAPYASQALDATAARMAPFGERLAGMPARPALPGLNVRGIDIPRAVTPNSVAVANLIKAGRAGATRAQLQAQAEQDGVPPETVERLIKAKGLDTKFQISGGAAGMVEPGNVDLTNRPDVPNADGTHSSVRSMSFEEGGQEILVPTVSEDGRIMSDDEAIAQYHKTGRHLGKFRSPREATAYASRLHDQQEAQGPR